MNSIPLILIDVQEGFKAPYWGVRNNPNLEENIDKLLGFWRQLDAPIYHVQHLSKNPLSPLWPTSPGVDFMDFARPRPGERVFQKQVNSAFIGTELESTLRKAGATEIVLIGLTTDHCVSTSARMASNLGFKVTIPSDAVATFNRKGLNNENYSAEQVHLVSLASLDREFATVMSIDSLITNLSTRRVIGVPPSPGSSS